MKFLKLFLFGMLFILGLRIDVYAYDYGSILDVSEVYNSPKDVFNYIDNMYEFLNDESNINSLKQCYYNDNIDTCTEYFKKLSSKSLSSFMKINANEDSLKKLKSKDFKYYTLSLNSYNAYNEYIIKRAKIIEAVSKLYNLGLVYINFFDVYDKYPEYFEQKQYNEFLSSDGLGRYYFPMIAYYIVQSGKKDIDFLFNSAIQKIEQNPTSYDSQKFAELANVAKQMKYYELAMSPKIPNSSNAETINKMTDDIGQKASDFMVNYFSSDYRGNVDKALAQYTAFSDVFNVLAGYELVSTVKDALDTTKSIFDRTTLWLDRSQDIKNVTINCSGKCGGSKRDGEWRLIDNFYVAPDIADKIDKLDSWSKKLESCTNGECQNIGGGDSSNSDQSSGDFNSINHYPIASFEFNKKDIKVGGAVTATSTSSDPDGDTLTNSWTIYKPNGTQKTINGGQSVTFTALQAGSYTLLLNVTDGKLPDKISHKISVSKTYSQDELIYIDQNAYSATNINLGKCGFKNIMTMTVPEGENWSSIKVWASTGKDLVVLLDKDKAPSLDNSNGYSCSDGYAQKFNADRTYDFNKYVDSEWKHNFKSGDKIYVAAFSYDGISNEQFTIEVDKILDKDGDGVPDNKDAFQNDPNEQYDSDHDGVGDNADKFPNDPAASIDSDGDGHPDRWNDGYDESDSITGLKIDKYPMDKSRWEEGSSANTNIENFVERFYENVLGRTADAGGLNDWSSKLSSGNLTGEDLAKSFIFSQEFKNKNVDNDKFVKIMYKAFFGRDADEGGYSQWKTKLDNGASRDDVLEGFLNSQEFINLCNSYGITPDSGDDKADDNTPANDIENFVERFYENVLGRTADAGGLNDWSSKLSSGNLTGEDLAKSFIFSQEFKNKNVDNDKFVKIMYKAFFGRDADEGGYSQWKTKLDNGASRDDVLEGFLNSQEFINLCNSYGITPDNGDDKADTIQNIQKGQVSPYVRLAGGDGDWPFSYEYSENNGVKTLTLKSKWTNVIIKSGPDYSYFAEDRYGTGSYNEYSINKISLKSPTDFCVSLSNGSYINTPNNTSCKNSISYQGKWSGNRKLWLTNDPSIYCTWKWDITVDSNNHMTLTSSLIAHNGDEGYCSSHGSASGNLINITSNGFDVVNIQSDTSLFGNKYSYHIDYANGYLHSEGSLYIGSYPAQYSVNLSRQ